jgi:hypothetical protein
MVATWNIAADAAYYPREAEGSRRGSYYENSKEPPGRWYAPKGDFGLIDSAAVDPALFQRLYDGLDAAGRPLVDTTQGRRRDRVPAYDICFSASRSVSLIWAFAPDDLRKAIEEAHDKAALDVIDSSRERSAENLTSPAEEIEAKQTRRQSREASLG